MANRFWVGGVGTWDSSTTTNWAATSNGAGGQSVPVAGDAVTFDASSGAVVCTVNHATLNIASLTIGAMAGTLDFATNNNNITITGTFSGTGTGVRTLNMGNGTWTFSATSGSSSLWDCTTVTNFTLNANSSTISFTGTAPSVNRSFIGGGRTYNILSLAGTTTGLPVIFTGNNTFATLNLSSPANIVVNNSTQTITNAFAWAGDSTHLFSITGGGAAPGTIVATGGGTISWAFIQGITFTTGTVTATNSYDLRSNAGVTITNPPLSIGGRVIGG